MGWYASEELDSAWNEAKQLLLPFERGKWARLMLIVVLTGQGFSMPNFPSSPGTGTGGQSSFETTYGSTADSPVDRITSVLPDPSMTGMATASPGSGSLVAAVLLVMMFLGFFYISSVFEFIYYQSLLDRDVSIRQNFSRHNRRGARYFGFRLAVLFLALLLFAGSVAGIAVNPLMGGLALLAMMLGLLPLMVFLGLTHNFVLLGMMENDTGVVQAWKDFYPSLRDEWRQVGAYIFLRFAIKIVAGIATLVWAMVSLLVLLVPFGILAAVFYMIAPVLAAIPAVLGLIAWIIAILGLQVVIQTFLYYYAILVYHDLTA